MKVNGVGSVGGISKYNSSQDNRTYGTEGKKKKQKDEIVISAEAKELLGLQETSESKSQRLDELKQGVASGAYVVDARKIAEKLWPFLK